MRVGFQELIRCRRYCFLIFSTSTTNPPLPLCYLKEIFFPPVPYKAPAKRAFAHCCPGAFQRSSAYNNCHRSKHFRYHFPSVAGSFRKFPHPPVAERIGTIPHLPAHPWRIPGLMPVESAVFLYAGNKTEAVNYANQVIDGKYFDLIGDATDVLRSKEIVFSVYVDKFDQQVTDITNGTSYLIVKESFLNEMFDVANDGTNDLRIREGVGFDYGTNGIKMRKYKQENLWASTEGTVVLIRLSEMYYILAECAATPGEAAEFLNKVRNIRGVDPVVCTEANRLDEIEKEYRKEFYGEGQLFFFYKRHAYTTFLHSPVNQMAESNYMFSWPDNETLFGKTN